MSLLEDEKQAEQRAKTVFNERAKYTATYLNGVAIALIAVGTLSPAVSSHPANAIEASVLAAVGFVCVGGSLALHLVVRRILGDLR